MLPFSSYHRLSPAPLESLLAEQFFFFLILIIKEKKSDSKDRGRMRLHPRFKKKENSSIYPFLETGGSGGG